MAVKKLFVDNEGNELQCVINEDNKLHISIDNNISDPPVFCDVVLDKTDVQLLIKDLVELEKQLQEEIEIEGDTKA